MLTLSLIENIDEAQRLVPRWNELLANSRQNEPSVTPDWMLGWWRVFGGLEGRTLKFGTVAEDDRWLAIFPLLSRRHWYRPAIPFRRLEFVASGEKQADEICSDYLGVVVRRGHERRIAGAFARFLAEGQFGVFDELILPAMDGSAELPQLICQALGEQGLLASCRQVTESPHIPLKASFEDYLSTVGSSRRYRLRRAMADFEKWADGTDRFVRASTHAQVREGWQILKTLHRERWSAEGREGVFGSRRFCAFHEALMERLFERGALELSWLCAHGRPISVVYNIRHGDKIYFYQSGRSMDVPKRIQPGTLIHLYAIKRAISEGLKEYDLLPGPSRYKMELALTTRPIVEVRAVRNRALERTRCLVRASAQKLRGWGMGLPRPGRAA